MRRSAAPSQLLGNSAKKPRFMPPGKANTLYLKKEPSYSDLDIEVAEVKEKQQTGSTFVNSSSSACGFSPITSGKLDRGDAESWHSDMGVKSVYKTKTGKKTHLKVILI
uniref:Uncharacterized protein n=1 Tax=Sphaerodactylus townsendi TaxID=933632 RepID=A0ACB8FEX0_9SAUR